MSVAVEKQAFPIAGADEAPTAYAERLGQWYANGVSAEAKKDRGQYLTALPVARFMASLCSVSNESLKVLDPGAGTGILACALCEALAARPNKPLHIELDAFETDGELLGYLQLCLRYLENWLRKRGVALKFQVHSEDFLLKHQEAFTAEQGLFGTQGNSSRAYDIVICNPPYFKIAGSDPRALAAAQFVHGQPNVYALFMAAAALLLRSDGELIFITPRSFASGPYFRRFREGFFGEVVPKAIHLFDSRRDAFGRDEVLQENIILLAAKQPVSCYDDENARVRISRSGGSGDLNDCVQRQAPLRDVLNYDSADKILHVPVETEEQCLADVVNAWTSRLSAQGLAISTGPVVPFRAVPLLSDQGCVPETHAPLLWMQHVQAMQVHWPRTAGRKPQFILANEQAMPLLVPNKNYVLLRRFSSKEQHRRLIAAPYLQTTLAGKYLGLENHLNYIYRPGSEMTPEEVVGLSALLNSRLLDTYFRIFNGSTQVSATELRAMPLPALDILEQLGKRFLNQQSIPGELDAVVDEMFGVNTVSQKNEAGTDA